MRGSSREGRGYASSLDGRNGAQFFGSGADGRRSVTPEKREIREDKGKPFSGTGLIPEVGKRAEGPIELARDHLIIWLRLIKSVHPRPSPIALVVVASPGLSIGSDRERLGVRCRTNRHDGWERATTRGR